MTILRKPRSYPSSNWGWHRYYVNRFNKSQHKDAGYLADLYLLYHLAFGEERIPA